MGGILRAFAGMTVEDYEAAAAAFLRRPTPDDRTRYRDCGYLPMIELLALPRGERVHELHRLGR